MKAKFYYCLFILGFSQFFFHSLSGQVTINLVYKEKNNLTTIQTGDKFCMQLDYSVSSTTGNATGVKAEINLPDWVYGVSNFVGTVHAPVANFVFTNTPGSKKLTINFVSPLASGSTGVLEFCAIVNNFTTLNNTNVCSTAVITDSSGNTSGSQNFCINATAIPRICGQKTLLNGGAIGYNTTYRVWVKYNGGNQDASFGTLEAQNITLTDVLPSGAEFVSATLYSHIGSFVGTGFESGGVVTISVPNLVYHNYQSNAWTAKTYYADIVVKYNNPPFNVNQTITNSATIKFTPIGGSEITVNNGDNIGGGCISDLIEVTTLQAPSIMANISKNGGGTVYPGQQFAYDINFNNSGNVPLENLEIIDSIPNNIVVDQSAGYNGVRFDMKNLLDHVEYQTNLNSTWVSYPITGVNVVPVLPAGETFTKIKFVMISPFPANTQLGNYHVIYFKPKTEVTSSEVVSNCLIWHSTTSGIPPLASRTICNNNWTLQPRPTTAAMKYVMAHSPNCASPYQLGSTITFIGDVTADQGYANAIDPIVAFLIPTGFQYVPGSQVFVPNATGLPNPTLDIVENYKTIGGIVYNMHRFKFPAGSIMPYGTTFRITIGMQVTPLVDISSGYTGLLYATSTNASNHTPASNYNGNFVDTQDWDMDGNTTETSISANSAYNSCTIQIAPSASMESIKWVRGQLDAEYSRYPASGNTVQGGLADYRLVVKNTGNVPMKDIQVIDILPFIGDMGVIDLSARNTAWRPNLANPIIAPAGVTVYYSTAQNPCRDEMKAPSDPSPFPTGCTVPNWTLAPLPDITSVQSLKFDFGNIVINPLDSFILTWPMRAPTDAPSNGEIAWNSFGYVATRTDNNQPLLAAEPIKVGIKVFQAEPGIYGDYVWIDTNMDGIQNEVGTGVSGVVVELYRDNGDGISDPLTDVLVGYTVTDADGHYLFPNLIPADYYAVFYPPAGYVVTQTDQGGNDALDSDGIIMPVTHIDAGEDDRTWDLGLFLTPNCDLQISFVSVSPCSFDGVNSTVVVNAYVTWANAPAGQNINVTLNGVTQVIDVVGGAQQMAFVQFTIPANNTVFTIDACFTGGSTCCDQKQLKPVLPCNPSQCILDIVNTYSGSCNGTDYILDVEVNWSVPPAGEDIIVTAGGQTQTINVSGGITPPVCAVFTLPANGMTGLPVTASFETTTSCSDSGTYDSPTCVLPCEICPSTMTINGLVYGSGSAPMAEDVTTNGSTPLTENNIAGFVSTGSTEGIFYTFCTEITQPLLPLQNPYTRIANDASTGLTSTQALRIAQVFQAAGFNTATGFGAGNNTTTNMVAMQMAVWNAIYDTDYSISSGSFQLLTNNNLGVRAVADGWLAAAQLISTPNTVVQKLVHSTGQDLVFQNCISSEPGPCNSTNNNYILTGNVFFANAPTTGTLTISVSGGGSQVITSPFTSPISYSVSGLTSDGASHTVTATFSDEPTCTSTSTYTAPTSCLPTCNLAATCSTLPQTNCSPVNGGASVSITGGQGNITYLWSSGETTANITNKAAGTYTVTVTDDFLPGCTATCQATITSSTVNPTCNITANSQPSCANLTGGSITVNPSPAGTYTYNWSDIGSGSASRTGLTGGTYTVTVTNTTTSCTGVCQITLTTPTNCCNISAVVPQNVVCYDNGTPGLSTDNRIRFNANITNTNTSLTSYNVTINGGTTITPNTNVPYGPILFTLGPGTAGGGATFTVTVTDSATPGCTQTFQVIDPGNCTPGGPGDECPTPQCGTATIQTNGN